MADEAYTANEYAERELAAALANRALPPRGEGPLYCIGLPGHFCANEIPAERRAHGFALCVACAEVQERRG